MSSRKQHIEKSEHLCTFKGACSDPQPHPSECFQIYGDFGPEVESYLEGCIYICVVWEKSVKNPLRN